MNNKKTMGRKPGGNTGRIRKRIGNQCLRLLLLIKRNLKSPGMYVLLAAELAVLLLFRSAVFPTIDNQHFGVVSEESVYGDRICEELQAADPGNCRIVSDREELEELVRRGGLSSGFIFTERVREVIETGETAPCIIYVSGSVSASGAALRETVFAALLVHMDEQELLRYTGDGTTFAEGVLSEEAQKELTDTYHRYLAGGDVLQIWFETVDADGNTIGDNEEDPGTGRERAMTAILLFAAALFMAGGRFRRRSRQVTAAMTRREGFIWSWMEVLAPVFPIGIVLGAALGAAEAAAGRSLPAVLSSVLLLILVYCPISALYAAAAAACFRKEAVYLFAAVGLLLLAVITNPELIPVSAAIPQLGGLRLLFPPAWI